MAIFRLEAKIISRGHGHSAAAAAAYRTGTRIRDERSNKIHDYTNRTKGIVDSVILTPENSPAWAANSESLWNYVELGEKRKDAQLAREFILAMPKELSSEDQFQLAVDWSRQELVSRGMVAQISLHRPKDGLNPHVHIQTTLRKIEGERFSAKKQREWNDKGLLLHWRESWAGAVNEALDKAGRDERVDHRSLKDQGIDRLPEPKLGKAVAMKERGAVDDPERFKLWRWVKSFNRSRSWMRGIEKHGEVMQAGIGKTWWERSLFLAQEKREAVKDVVMEAWEKLLRSRPMSSIPPKDHGFDMER